MKKQSLIASLLVSLFCLLCVMPSMAVGVSTTKSGAESIFLGTTYTIQFKKDGISTHWFKMTTTSRSTNYRINLHNMSVNSKLTVNIYETKYEERMASVSASYSGSSFADITLDSSKNFYISISRAKNTSTTGEYYEFSIEELRNDAGTSEKDAYALEIDTVYEKELNNTKTDDWFKFRTPSMNNVMYRVKLENLDVETNVIPTIYESTYMQQLSSAKSSKGNTSSQDLKLNPDSMYYIAVKRDKKDRMGAYKLSIETVALDSGTDQASAMPLELNKIYYKEHSTLNQAAWFKFTTSQKYANYRITLVNQSIPCKTTVSLLYGRGLATAKSASATNGVTTTLDFCPGNIIKPATEQTYYLKIARDKAGNIGRYSIEVTEYPTNAAYSVSESGLFPLTINKSTQGQFDIAGNEDWFSFTPAIDMEVSVNLSNLNVAGGLVADVYERIDESGTLSSTMVTVKAGSGATGSKKVKLTAYHNYSIRVNRSKNANLGLYAIELSAEVSKSNSVSAGKMPIRLFIDGYPVECDQPPVLINDRTLVPVRAIFEKLNANVDWNADSRTVTVYDGTISIVLPVDRTDVTVNGRSTTLDVPAQIVSGRTMVPIRFIAETLGATVTWEQATQSVHITLP